MGQLARHSQLHVYENDRPSGNLPSATNSECRGCEPGNCWDCDRCSGEFRVNHRPRIHCDHAADHHHFGFPATKLEQLEQFSRHCNFQLRGDNGADCRLSTTSDDKYGRSGSGHSRNCYGCCWECGDREGRVEYRLDASEDRCDGVTRS